ncbi:MAG: deaminase [Patescibacteria group bacterium]|jgi:deoxycytidylate deaminase
MEFLKGQREEEAKGWLLKATEVAKKALCLKAKCGAVIVKEGKIIGEGYTAPPLDKEENRVCGKDFPPGKPKYDRTCCVHAEWRAVFDALRRNSKDVKGATIYFSRVDENGGVEKSGQPLCTVCSRMVLDVGIEKFVLWHEEGIAEYLAAEFNLLSYEYKHII